MKIKTSVIPSYLVLAILFFLGGVLQRLSIISITKTNIITVAIIILVLVRISKICDLSKFSLKVYPILLYFFYILFVFLYHQNSIVTFLAFSLSTIIPLSSFLFSKKVLCKNNGTADSILKFFYLISIVQVPILLIQGFCGADIIAFLNTPTALIDFRTGTFFINSDSTLGLFANLFLIYLLFQSRNRISKKQTVFFILLLFAIIMLINSKMSKLAFIFVWSIFLLDKTFSANKFLAMVLLFSIFLAIIVIFANLNLNEYSDALNYERFRIDNLAEQSATLPRYAVFLLLLKKGALFGNGLYNYYNYFTKEWKFYAGHSLWFSLYNDTGPLGCLLILWFYWKIFLASAKIKLVGFAQFSLAMFYSSISFLLYDAGAMLLLTFFSCINEVKGTSIALSPQRTMLKSVSRLCGKGLSDHQDESNQK